MKNLTIENLAIADLTPRPSNPRTHSEEQIAQIARSIERFGFTNPVLIDENHGIIAGHGRVAAAKTLGIGCLPCVRLANMSEADIRAYVIADNKLAENAGWDRELLAIEFAWLEEVDNDFDLTITGFELPEIDILLDQYAQASANGEDGDGEDSAPKVADGPAVTRTGDIWIVGDHRLACGDALNAEIYYRLMDQDRAHMVFCDPPYNVPISGHVSGMGAIKHREFAMASGEMSPDQFVAFLTAACTRMAEYSIDGSLHYICMDWRGMDPLLRAGDVAYKELKNLCVWAKTNGGMGSLYRSQHELVFVFKAGNAPHINNVELGKHGRNRTNVWSYPGANSFGEARGDLAIHPTVKPVALVADAIRDASHRGQIVLDPFAGSGSTLIAAERTARRARAIEIDPAYCDVIVTRMADACGIDARLEGSGESFDKVAQRRLRECKAQSGDNRDERKADRSGEAGSSQDAEAPEVGEAA